eukprot:1859874-Alexandrium_andersonii.AAC.1
MGKPSHPGPTISARARVCECFAAAVLGPDGHTADLWNTHHRYGMLDPGPRMPKHVPGVAKEATAHEEETLNTHSPDERVLACVWR